MYRILLASLMLSAAPAAMAQEDMTQLGAHVHGVGELSIALDPASGELVIELNGPAYNIYGFERAPQSEEEERRVEAAHSGLLRGDQFVFTAGTDCTWVDTEVFGGPVINGHDHEGHDHGHDHEHDDHDHGEHHHDHDDHGHDHEGHDHAHDDHAHDHDDHDHGHSDMLVRWRYSCESAADFTSVDATVLFDVLPSLNSLDVQFFDGTRADADALSRDRRSFEID